MLGHEIAHITKKHTVNAIQKNKAIKMTTEEVGAKGSAYYSKLANAAYDNIVERDSIAATRTMPIRRVCGSPTRAATTLPLLAPSSGS